MSRASTEAKRLHKADFGKERIDLLYEDEWLCIVFKPSGLLSVPYPGSRARTAIDALELLMRKRGTFSASHRPFVVHRLDRDTSGVMMFAFSEASQQKIMDTWQTMVTRRLYHAVAENPSPRSCFAPLADSGTIDAPLAYNSHNIGFVPKAGDHPAEGSATKQALRHRTNGSIYERNLAVRGGRAEFKTIPAVTHYRVLCRGTVHTLIELDLETGRKNQIRAHLASKGYPLAGDENYRAKTDPFGRLALHARTLEFDHPYTGEHLCFEVPEPDDWLSCVQNGSGGIPAVWSMPHHQQKHGASRPDSVLERMPGRRKRGGMDFIQKGKLHR